MPRKAFLLPLLAWASMTPVAATPPVEGVWGAPGTRLVLSADRALIQEDCAEIALPPLSPAADGRFSAEGRMTAYDPGPQNADAPPRGVPVKVTGRMEGEVMELAIAQEGAKPRAMTLRHGFRGKIIRCL